MNVKPKRRIYPRNSIFGRMYFKHKHKHWMWKIPEPCIDDSYFYQQSPSSVRFGTELSLDHEHALIALAIWRPTFPRAKDMWSATFMDEHPSTLNKDTTVSQFKPVTQLGNSLPTFIANLKTTWNEERKRYEISYQDKLMMFMHNDDMVEDIYNIHRVSDTFKCAFKTVLDKVQAKFTADIATLKNK